MRYRARKNRRLFEQLECRRCLTVSAQVDDGDLFVTGQADGAVEISATGDSAYQVTDNGIAIGTFEEVDGDIKIRLDDDGTVNDTVNLNLGGHEVDRVFVDLGDGDNSFSIQNGTVTGSFRYAGGDGNDSVTIAADATVERSISVNLRDGDDSLTVAGTVQSFDLRGGDGDDSVEIAAGAQIARNGYLYLGDGANTVTVSGEVIGNLLVWGGADDDTITLLAEAQIGRSVSVQAGAGTNQLVTSAIIDGGLSYDGRDGDDTVRISAEATIGRNVSLRLGDGSNSVSHDGSIEGSLTVTSLNEDDTVNVADSATVGGQTTLTLGEQFDGRHCSGHRGPVQTRGNGGTGFPFGGLSRLGGIFRR